jgi:hypothetical protein
MKMKAKCLYGDFTIDGCKLTIDKAWAPEVIETAFRGSRKIPLGGPSAGDPDMVLAERMLAYFPNTGKIIEYKPPEIDPDVVY